MSDFQKIIKNVAPTLSMALGGPLAGTALGYIASHLLDKSGASQVEVEKAIESANPETLKKLQSLDAAFKQEMANLSINVEEISRQAGKSAFTKLFDKRRLTLINLLPQILLSLFFVLGYFFVLIYLLNNPSSLSTSNPHVTGVFTTIIGVLTAAIPQILGFWFGSSLGSKEKTQKLADTDKTSG